MAIDTIADRISKLEPFAGLSRDEIDAIVRISDRIVYRDRQTIVEADSEGDGSIVIISGQAVILANPDRAISETVLDAGSMIGETAMLTEHAFSITVRADGDVRAIKISRDAMHELLAANPVLREHFERRLTARLSRTVMELRMIDERLSMAAASTPEPDEVAQAQ